MKITYDPAKDKRNFAERGLSFGQASELDWSTALVVEDTRQDYGERRFRALAYLNHRLCAVVFTPRKDGIRVISFRKANLREVKQYEQAQTRFTR